MISLYKLLSIIYIYVSNTTICKCFVNLQYYYYYYVCNRVMLVYNQAIVAFAVFHVINVLP